MATIQNLDSEIAKKIIQPVYCFLGEEDYLKREYINKIAQVFLGESWNLGLETLYGSEIDADGIIDRAQSLGLFAEKKVLVVKEIDALSSKNRKKLLDYLKTPAADTCHILTSTKLDRKNSFFKELNSQLTVYIFDPLKGDALERWVKKRAEEIGYRISQTALQLLLDISGQSLGLLEQELLKITVYLDSHNRREITDADIKSLASSITEVGGFELAEALARKGLKESLKLFHEMLQVGEDPVRMLVAINYRFNILWQIFLFQQDRLSLDEMASRLRLNPYLVRLVLPLASKRNAPQYLRAFALLYNAERRLKSGRGDPRTVVQQLIYKLAV